MSFHNNSVARALGDLFPEITFDPSLFHSNICIILLFYLFYIIICFFVFIDLYCYLDWMDVRNRRKFFEKYAREHGFNPTDPEGWYKQNKKQILETKVLNNLITLIVPCIFIYFIN